MNKLSVLLVEDKHSFAIEVEMLIDDMGHQLLPVVDDAEEAIAAIKKKRPDLILMDIDLNGKLTGLDVANLIKHLNIPIIFTTSFNDQPTYQKTKLVNAVGYLVKPFDKLTLQSSIENAIHFILSDNENEYQHEKEEVNLGEAVIQGDRVFIKQSGMLRKINLEDIIYLQGEGNYTTIATENRRYVIKISMKKLFNTLPVKFVIVHRNYALHVDKIDGINLTDNTVHAGELSFPLGRKYKPGVLEQFELLK